MEGLTVTPQNQPLDYGMRDNQAIGMGGLAYALDYLTAANATAVRAFKRVNTGGNTNQRIYGARWRTTAHSPRESPVSPEECPNS
jgi:hypothetical protein